MQHNLLAGVLHRCYNSRCSHSKAKEVGGMTTSLALRTGDEGVLTFRVAGPGVGVQQQHKNPCSCHFQQSASPPFPGRSQQPSTQQHQRPALALPCLPVCTCKIAFICEFEFWHAIPIHEDQVRRSSVVKTAIQPSLT